MKKIDRKVMNQLIQLKNTLNNYELPKFDGVTDEVADYMFNEVQDTYAVISEYFFKKGVDYIKRLNKKEEQK